MKNRMKGYINMSKLHTMITKINSPWKMIYPMGRMGLFNWMSDATYVKLLFRGEMGSKLNLNDPKTFNEKLQWLKIYDHRDEYIDLVDKIKAKEVVGTIVGEEHIVPMYGAWENADEIPFDSLPDQYVLKCNHDQGSVIVVSDKSNINEEDVRIIFNKKLNRSIFPGTREYPYKTIQPRVFAEHYLGGTMIDYKFYCFNGEPKFLYCSKGMLRAHVGEVAFYDLNWNQMPFYRTDYQRLNKTERPLHFDEMVHIAKQLSKDIPFVRIDLFEVNNKVYFSEFTLCPASGLMPFVPAKYDRIVGDMLDLSKIMKQLK